MILSKLFTPKWKHKSPQVRKRTLLALDAKAETSQSIYIDVVKNDPELFIRRIALQRITDIDQVQSFRDSRVDKEIYEEATKRLCELLSGYSDKYSVDQLLDRLKNITEYRVFEYVARYGRFVELQKYAINKIDSDTVLVDVIANTESIENKQLALEKLKSVNALKNVVKLFKRKDKNIVALAQEKIDKLSEQRDGEKSAISEYRRVAKDFQELFHLCKLSGEWEKYNIRLRGLYEQWRGLAIKHNIVSLLDDKEFAKIIEDSYEYFEQQLVQQLSQKTITTNWNVSTDTGVDQTLTEMHRLNTKLENELAKLDRLVLSELGSTQTTLKQLLEDSRKQWRLLNNDISDSVLNDKQETEFQRINTAYKAAELKLSNVMVNLDELEEFVEFQNKLQDDAQQLMQSDEMLERVKINELIDRFDEIQTPEFGKFAEPLLTAAKQTKLSLIEKIKLLDQQSLQFVDELRELNVELQQTIDQGRSRHASHLINRGRKIIRLMTDPHKKMLENEGEIARFNNLAHLTNELQDWRQWSSGSVKEQLILKMQKLADEVIKNKDEPGFDFEAAANTIKNARSEWQNLQAGGPDDEGKKLWLDFNDACNLAYEPCQQYFDRLNQQREANLQLRETICSDLERYRDKIAHSEADLIDWNALNKIMRTARQDWKKLGETKRNDWLKINTRFNSALKALQTLLQEQQMLNRDAKQNLIGQVEALSDKLAEKTIEIDEAIKSVLQIQAKWKSIGIAVKDKQLWSQFKQCCDAVFAVRSAEQQRISHEIQEVQQTRLGIIESIFNLASGTTEMLLQAKPKLSELTSKWDQLPKLKSNHELQRRFNSAQEKFNKALLQLQKVHLKAQKKLLRANVALAYDLEKHIYEYFDGIRSSDQLIESVAYLRSRWHQIDVKNLDIAEKVSDWFERLVGYVEKIIQGGRAEIEQIFIEQQKTVEKTRDIICIQMEILAGVESPLESKQRRMEFQVAQLAKHMMQSNSVEVQSRIHDLLTQWYESGPISPEKAMEFEQRLYSVLCLLDKDYE